MKRLVMAMLLLTSIGVAAQGNVNRKGRGFKADLTSEQMATLHTKKLTLALDLTEGQQERIMEINLAQAERLTAKREELKAKKEQGELKRPTADERFEIENARLDRQIAHHQEMKEILTDDQYQTWKKLKLRKRMNGKKKMQEKGRRG
ncbi:DUF4890 domain-containing protein [Flagellimonas myxillae]|uniref:DUF4890 domain-containing protein n=1 Tax=Flagellimonas myxillae TaxID=2942214 RepID=UPI00201E960D|nr:DUF4890 domain-containing protein [Muricauda myxillae]MCL6267831.1 DUF4890 domain-containing protein [Muricauda myxillae]